MALAGGGVADGSTVKNQRVFVELDLPGNLVGAWVRGWTQVLDPETARHVRLDGGSARVRTSASGGRASLVAPLADGSIEEAECVTLCAGSIGSPAILMRSGIGPKRELEAAGIQSRRRVE